MSTGLPIVASDIPGVSNLLGVNNEYGVCAANDALSFSQAILGLVDSAEFTNALSARAYVRIRENYSHEVMLQRYLDVVTECKK